MARAPERFRRKWRSPGRLKLASFVMRLLPSPAQAPNSASVLSKPRTASSLAVRQRSVASTGSAAPEGRLDRRPARSRDADRKDAGSSTARREGSSRRAARRSCPRATAPDQASAPSAPVRTGAKKVRHGMMSRRVRPSFAAARQKLSRVLRSGVGAIALFIGCFCAAADQRVMAGAANPRRSRRARAPCRRTAHRPCRAAHSTGS